MQITVRQTETIDEVELVGMLKEAAKEAVNTAEAACVRALEAETLEAFDNPTAWAQKAFASFKARERDGEIDGLVFVKTAQSDWLFERNIFGGELSAGDPGTSAKLGIPVPGPDGPLTAAGGLQRGAVGRVMNSGNGFMKDLPDGNVAVLERSLDGGLDLIAIFVHDAHYAPRFDFFDVVEKIALNVLPAAYSSALSKRLE